MNLTFIVPSYNQSRFLKTCLDSIVTNYPAEVFVIDGGSKDASVEIIKKHPSVTEWVSEPDRGQAHAVNKGLAKATGDLIFWINSDDYYVLGAIQKTVEYFEQNKGTLIIYGRGYHVDENNKYLYDYKTEPWNYRRLLDVCFLCQPSVVFRREIYEEFGGLDERLQCGLDLEYWLRIGKKYAFEQVNFPIAISRLWNGSKSSQKQFEMQEEALRLSYVYGGKWSSRRFWGLVENWTRCKCPNIRKNSLLYFFRKMIIAVRIKQKINNSKCIDLMSNKLFLRN